MAANSASVRHGQGKGGDRFIARELLQRADLVILDESFVALDPQNLQLTLRYVVEKAPKVLVIAHP